MLQIREEELERLVAYVQKNVGINLREKRALIEGRLSTVISDRGYDSLHDYLNTVMADPTGREIFTLVDCLTTNHTYFMREAEHFEFLRQRVLPELENRIRDRDLRIWSAGCSSGEEPYTLAMVLADHFGLRQNDWDTKILATDISEQVIRQAREGVYPAEALDVIPPAWKQSFFKKNDGQSYRISDRIKNEVLFRYFNLMETSFPFRRRFHVIFCRNVMIYFDAETKAELIEKFYQHLEVGVSLHRPLGEHRQIPVGIPICDAGGLQKG